MSTGYNTISASHPFRVDNLGADPSTTPGTSVVPGASSAEGTYTQILSALAQEVNGFVIWVIAGASAVASKPHLLDIGIDPAGGTSYTTIIANIICGGAAPVVNLGSGRRFFFPMRIPAGATVAVRIQGGYTIAGTVRVGIVAYGQRGNGWSLPVGQYSETIGAITNSSGVAFTPGNASDGTYVSLGTLARPLWWWQLCAQVEDSTANNLQLYVDLAVGDATNKTIINRTWMGTTNAEETGDPLNSGLIWHANYWPLPAGAELWVRGRVNGTPDAAYNAVAVGVG